MYHESLPKEAFPGNINSAMTNIPAKRRKFEAVIVCVHYSDFLVATINNNRKLFDKMVVVTDTKDTETKRVCEFYNVECVQTDCFYENDNPLNKAKGINAGMARLSQDSWVVHLDADIFLPPLTRAILERVDLDSKGLYGIDRLMCKSYAEWQNYAESPKLIHQQYCYIDPTAFPMGRRLGEYYNTGFTPIGFFQLWNPKESGINFYPDEHGSVDRSDVLFAKQFTREHRHLLPEIICIHLESEKAPQGANWKGRTTMPFTFAAAAEMMSKKDVSLQVAEERHYNRFQKLIKFLFNI